MSGRLAGRAGLVTGATKGIGRETARLMAREGAKVVCAGRDAADGAAVVEEIRSEGGEAIFVPLEVASEAAWASAVRTGEAAFDRLDLFVGNAGIFFVKTLVETGEADVRAAFDVNLRGAALAVKHGFAAIDRAGRDGAIVIVSSLMGLVGYPGAAAYCASKGAATGLVKTAALAGARRKPRVRVNSVHPGVIWTSMITSQFGEDQALADAFAADTPLRMVGRPQHIAEAIVFLLGEESARINGAEIMVDGGRGAD